MEKFAGYGFNKSHAAAYALLAYQTAYMKAHHAAAFAAANLSAVMDDTDKVRQFHDDAVANGLTVLPPDVNASEYRFVPVDRAQPALRPWRGARHGAGGDRSNPGSAQGRSVQNLFDFCTPVDKRLVNRRVLEALIRAGAFDALDAQPRAPARLARGARSRRPSRPSARRARRACSARPRRRAAARTSPSRRRRGMRGRSCWRRRPRSASISRRICSRSTSASWRNFRARRSPSSARRTGCGWPGSWSRRACR